MKYNIKDSELRSYNKDDSCIFKKNNDAYGALSNMSTKFPLTVNNIKIKTSEALYQACKFPHNTELQREIIQEKSPMKVKMLSKAHKLQCRSDWDSVRLKIMRWCIQLKLIQNFVTFGEELHLTGTKAIVENSSNDNFWGAIPDKNEMIFTGQNALGRLLMELRQKLYSRNWIELFVLAPPEIDNFVIYKEPICIIDERLTLIHSLLNYWEILDKNYGSKELTPKWKGFPRDLKANILGENIFDIHHTLFRNTDE